MPLCWGVNITEISVIIKAVHPANPGFIYKSAAVPVKEPL